MQRRKAPPTSWRPGRTWTPPATPSPTSPTGRTGTMRQPWSGASVPPPRRPRRAGHVRPKAARFRVHDPSAPSSATTPTKIRLAEGHASLPTVCGRQRVSRSIPPCHVERADFPVPSASRPWRGLLPPRTVPATGVFRLRGTSGDKRREVPGRVQIPGGLCPTRPAPEDPFTKRCLGLEVRQPVPTVADTTHAAAARRYGSDPWRAPVPTHPPARVPGREPGPAAAHQAPPYSVGTNARNGIPLVSDTTPRHARAQDAAGVTTRGLPNGVSAGSPLHEAIRTSLRPRRAPARTPQLPGTDAHEHQAGDELQRTGPRLGERARCRGGRA